MINEDLRTAIKSQIELIEKHYDENLDKMIKLQEQIEWYKKINVDNMEQIRKLSDKLREM